MTRPWPKKKSQAILTSDKQAFEIHQLFIMRYGGKGSCSHLSVVYQRPSTLKCITADQILFYSHDGVCVLDMYQAQLCSTGFKHFAGHIYSYHLEGK